MLQGTELIKQAKIISFSAHKGQYRRDGKTPYATHPVAVAGKFMNPTLHAIALLHDVIEDTNITKEDLLKEGIYPLVVDAVEAMTKQKEEKYLDYILRVKENQLATLVKIEDIKHNYDTVHKIKQERYDIELYILREK